MLVSLARVYVDAVNRHAVPSIGDAWTEVVKSECEVRRYVPCCSQGPVNRLRLGELTVLLSSRFPSSCVRSWLPVPTFVLSWGGGRC